MKEVGGEGRCYPRVPISIRGSDECVGNLPCGQERANRPWEARRAGREPSEEKTGTALEMSLLTKGSVPLSGSSSRISHHVSLLPSFSVSVEAGSVIFEKMCKFNWKPTSSIIFYISLHQDQRRQAGKHKDVIDSVKHVAHVP